jgi:hypothetical protein
VQSHLRALAGVSGRTYLAGLFRACWRSGFLQRLPRPITHEPYRVTRRHRRLGRSWIEDVRRRMSSTRIPIWVISAVSDTVLSVGRPTSTSILPNELGTFGLPPRDRRCWPNFGRQIHGRRRKPPSQGWKTFLRNHADGVASIDLFVVPTISFRLLYGLLILRHDRRRVLCLGVTAHRRPNGLRDNSPRHSAGSPRQGTSSAIAVKPTAKSLPNAFVRWAFVTSQRRRDRRGRMDIRNG